MRKHRTELIAVGVGVGLLAARRRLPLPPPLAATGDRRPAPRLACGTMEHTEVSWRLIVKIVLVTAATLVGLYLVYQVRSVIGLLLIAVFLALAVAPAVNWLA